MKAMQIRSPSGTSSPGDRARSSFPTGRLSPVSAASSISSVAATKIRPSAGTRLPASTRTTSPGTSSSASISIAWPSRRTRAIVFIILASASTLASAFASWRRPITALNTVSPASRTVVPMSSVTSALIDRGRQQDDLHEVLVLAHEGAGTRTPSWPRRACWGRGSGAVRRPPPRVRPRSGSTSSCWVTARASIPYQRDGDGWSGRALSLPRRSIGPLCLQRRPRPWLGRIIARSLRGDAPGATPGYARAPSPGAQPALPTRRSIERSRAASCSLLARVEMGRQRRLFRIEPREQLLDLSPAGAGERDADQPAVLRGLGTAHVATTLERGHDPRRRRPADPDRGGEIAGLHLTPHPEHPHRDERRPRKPVVREDLGLHVSSDRGRGTEQVRHPPPSHGSRAAGGRAPRRPCARRAAGRRRPEASRRIVAAPRALAGDEGVGGSRGWSLGRLT